MNESSFITFFTYMQRQIVIPFLKELFVAFKVAPNIKKPSLYCSSYRPLLVGEPKSPIVQKHTLFAPERYTASILYTDSLNSA